MAPVVAFEDSRRLTGPNLFFAACGAVLATAAGWTIDAAREAAWRANIAVAFDRLGWPLRDVLLRYHAGGAQLAIAADVDQLLTATSVNEWAWHEALGLPWAVDEDSAPVAGREAALAVLKALAAQERNPVLMALLDAADAHGLPALLDDDALSIGSGAASMSWPLAALPTVDEVRWADLHAVPSALVTGSNGKTTTARLIGAIAREAGLRTGTSCTEGLYLSTDRFESGDYSGPAGARAILRHPQVELAVLETARGGMLRRGLALARADAAIVTNVSADHFGEYGIDDLSGVADAKLIVAHAVAGHGMLVLNADDAVLAARAAALPASLTLGWFALDDAEPRLAAHRGHLPNGGATCGLRDGRMRLVAPALGIAEADLGAVDEMPLTLAGHARYNIANLLGAALVAAALGLPVDAIRSVFARFGADPADNPGRLAQWRVGDVRVVVDYAHNPDGLHGLLTAVSAEPHARLGLLLGQAGNRGDADIRALAGVAASFRPALIVLKDIAGMERGRSSGEVASLLRDELLRLGIAPDRIAFESGEVDAARHALAWARPGDLLVLPIHGRTARDEVEAILRSA